MQKVHQNKKCIRFNSINSNSIVKSQIIQVEFPDVFKLAKMILIFKKGASSLTSNCIHDQMYEYFNILNLLSYQQHGFRKKTHEICDHKVNQPGA